MTHAGWRRKKEIPERLEIDWELNEQKLARSRIVTGKGKCYNRENSKSKSRN